MNRVQDKVCIVTGAALGVLLSIVTWFETPGGWFHFVPPPPGLVAVAMLLSLSALALIEAWRGSASD